MPEMLLFTIIPVSDLDLIREQGLEGTSADPIQLHPLPPAASRLGRDEVVLAVATGRLAEEPLPRNGRYGLTFVPPRAIENLDPYRPVREIAAAGGYVVRMRPESGEPDVLLIHRRNVWDLPKGKLDPGETPEEGALREVREEVGIEHLELIRPLGTTLHGFHEKGWFVAKTTFWFLMTTAQEAFTPEEKEGIDAVEWMPWSRARSTVGFPNLRAHMVNLGMEALRP